MGCKVALCIPTYERSEAVRDFLNKCSAYYIAEGIDIFYFDSSKSDDTEKVYESWPDHEHVHYKRLSSDIAVPAKVYAIIREPQIYDGYDFIWLSNDGVQCTPKGLERLKKAFDTRYDLITIDHFGYDKREYAEYTDKNEFFGACAWLTVMLGGAIANLHTLFRGTDWSEWKEIFHRQPFAEWAINDFYFRRILDLDSFVGLKVDMPQKQDYIKFSSKKKNNYWRQRAFQVICEYWTGTIERLPEYYSHKKSVCLQGAYYLMLGELPNLTDLRREGIFSFPVFLKYFNAWDKVTIIPKGKLLALSLTPAWILSLPGIIKNLRLKSALKRFCSKRQRIAIYGTGEWGTTFAEYFQYCGLDFDCFCASRVNPDKREYMGKPVYVFNEMDTDGVGFIVGLGRENATEVMPVLWEKLNQDQFFFLPDYYNRERHYYDAMRYALGYRYLTGAAYTA